MSATRQGTSQNRRWRHHGTVMIAVASVFIVAGCGVSISTPDASPTSSISSSSPTSTMPTAAIGWKNYTDAGKTVSFDLPADWITQQLSVPGNTGLAVEVKDAKGTKIATLQTHVSGLGGACGPNTLRPYTVLASVPLQIPANTKDPDALEPRYVYRLIQGANHFFASYGIADHSAGVDGMTCLVYNSITTDKLGIVFFGDVPQFTSDPDGTAGTKPFSTIPQAQDYMLTPEYQKIEKMITSLKVLG